MNKSVPNYPVWRCFLWQGQDFICNLNFFPAKFFFWCWKSEIFLSKKKFGGKNIYFAKKIFSLAKKVIRLWLNRGKFQNIESSLNFEWKIFKVGTKKFAFKPLVGHPLINRSFQVRVFVDLSNHSFQPFLCIGSMKIGSVKKPLKPKPPNRKHGKLFKNSTQFFSIKLGKNRLIIFQGKECCWKLRVKKWRKMQMKNANVQVKEKQKFIIMNFKNEFLREKRQLHVLFFFLFGDGILFVLFQVFQSSFARKWWREFLRNNDSDYWKFPRTQSTNKPQPIIRSDFPRFPGKIRSNKKLGK